MRKVRKVLQVLSVTAVFYTVLLPACVLSVLISALVLWASPKELWAHIDKALQFSTLHTDVLKLIKEIK